MTQEADELGRVRQLAQLASSSVSVAERLTSNMADQMDQEARDEAKHALARMDSHEQLCTERWRQSRESTERVEKTLNDIRTAVNKRIGQVPATIISLMSGLIGLMGGLLMAHH